MAEGIEQRESTAKDYWNITNPAAIPFNNPELKFKASQDTIGDLQFDSDEFQTYYKDADGDTKKSMLNANNLSDAVKTAQRRDIFNDSMKATEQDGIVTQLGMGLLPAIASPSSFIPMGAVFKAGQLAKATSRLSQAAAFGSVGAVAGAGANVIDEAIFDMQGMPTNYLGAAAIGGIFGGFLGGFAGMMVGPQNKNVANAISPENDSFTKDFDRDPFIEINLDENGIPMLQPIAQMEKSLLDKVPWLGEKFRSDVHTVYQDESSLLRGFMGRLSPATLSLKDNLGNVLPINKTGIDIKREAKGMHNILTKNSQDAYREARGLGYAGDHEKFNQDVWAIYMEAMNRQKTEAASYANQKTAGKATKDITEAERNALLKENRKAMDEFYNERPIEFTGDKSLVKGAEAYRNYFQSMLKNSQKMGIKQLDGINVNRLYAPRTYNYKGIKDGSIKQDVVFNEVRLGLANDVRNRGMSQADLDVATKDIVDMLNKSAFDLNNLNTSYMVKDLPFSTHLKQKKLYLNETYMPNIVKNNFEDVTGAYHYKMSGRQATQYAFGTDDLSEVMKLIREEHLAQGKVANEKSIQAFERVVKDVLGDLRMNQLADTPAWTFTRNLTSYNSLRLGGGFGGNQFIELVSSVAMNGTKALMSGRILKSLTNTADLLYTHKGKHDEFSNYLIGSGYMENALHTSRINRYADTEAGFNSGWLENKLQGMNDTLMKINGMRYFMGVMEDMTGGAIVTQLKQGGIDANRLARWGLSEADAKTLGKRLDDVTLDDGWDISALSAKEQGQLQLAISRGIDEIVVQGDSIHLPAWMKAPGPFTKVITQFLRFPMIAQETLLRKGMAEEKAQMVAGVLTSIATFMSLKYLREQASMSMGTVSPIDAKYDYANYSDDDYLRVIGEALNYTAPMGMMAGLVNYGAIATGQPELGREWTSQGGMSNLMGPSGGVGDDLISIMTAGVEGNLDTERTYKKYRNLVPMQNLPFIKEGGDWLIEEYGR